MRFKAGLLVVAIAFVLVVGASNGTITTEVDGTLVSNSCLADVGAQVWIDGGSFIMGADDTYPEEGPAHAVLIDGFWIDVTEVTNAQFERFVLDTGYITVAERIPDPADWPDAPTYMLQPGSVVFKGKLVDEHMDSWWSFVPGANWRHPNGPNSSIQGKESYPVVHVAYEDALAYAEWSGRQLPTEAQLEYVARSKLNASFFAWDSKELAPDGKHLANTWQGAFPISDSGEDGYAGLAPVGCFPANAYGVYDLIGNVWEWTSNWYAPKHSSENSVNPKGPIVYYSYSPEHSRFPAKVIKGGSYLCAPNYCKRYRPAARQAQDIGLGTSHLGFRTVLVPKPK